MQLQASRFSFFVHIHGDSAPIVVYRKGSIFMDFHNDMSAIACQCFINRVVYNLVDKGDAGPGVQWIRCTWLGELLPLPDPPKP